jgi:hypothetical protein
MKKLIILTLFSLLGGCVSYYQPETALEDGVYYPEDDPAYVLNSSDYSGVIVYPWSSLDYFYMSYGGFYGHRFAYGYPYGWGYSPFGYPYGYYGHRRAWHFASYYDPYRWPYRGHLSHPGNSPHIQTGDSYDQRERYAGDDGGSAQDRDTADVRDDYTFHRKSGETSSVRRYVTTAPPGYSGNQGMVVRNSANKKTGSSHHLEPSKSTSAKSSSVNLSSPAPVVRPAARTTSTSGSGTRTRSPSVSRSSGRQSSAGSKSARRRDRD